VASVRGILNIQSLNELTYEKAIAKSWAPSAITTAYDFQVTVFRPFLPHFTASGARARPARVRRLSPLYQLQPVPDGSGLPVRLLPTA
jgi:hypothetical protein